jgi:chorismate--pyruvate lyase
MKTTWKSLRSLAALTELTTWLTDAGSFVRRLKASGIQEPRIKIINERREFPLLEETKKLGMPPRRYALIREVLIDSDEGQWMFARTVIPMTTLTGKEQQLSKLKNRTLGSYLFKEKTMRRSKFEFAQIETESIWFEKIKHFINDAQLKWWARRSVFHVHAKPLLLTEIFFPGIAALNHVDY